MTRPHGSAISDEQMRVGLAEVSRLLLDSTVLIDALRGNVAAGRVAGLRRIGTEPWVCVVSVEEIWRGVRTPEEPAVRRLFSGLRLAPLGLAEGIRAGTWRREFAERGVTLHQADCLIAAAAAGVGASLATANVSDFPMAEVVVEHWTS
jgi:predicted nucleic acid-binding protein